jgi:hypothetical protein
VVEAATLHRYCGHGVAVEWREAQSEEGKPAQRHRLWAGSLRVRGEKRILRFAQDYKIFAQDDKICAQDDKIFAQDDKVLAQDDKPYFELPSYSAIPAIPGPQVSQVNKRKRTL